MFAHNVDDEPPYEAQALRTLSDQFHGHLVFTEDMISEIEKAVEVCAKLDMYKKALFYGRQHPDLYVPSIGNSMVDFRNEEGEDLTLLLHAFLGKATEAGEMLEKLLELMAHDTGVRDEATVTNIIEEIGDSRWYDAIISRVYSVALAAVDRKNIAKLKARFPDKFTAEDANQRNLFAETEALKTS